MLKTFEVEGQKFEITVNNDDGTFWSEIAGESVWSSNLKGLETKFWQLVALDHDEKRHKVSFNIEKRWATGIHGGNGNLIVKEADGSTTQLRSWNRGDYVRRVRRRLSWRRR